jgi:hypothetical protein
MSGSCFVLLLRKKNCYFPLPLVLTAIDEGAQLIDWIFLLVTAVIAWHALTHRNDDGENDIGHLLFGAIALLFFVRVLFVDILKLL